MKKYNLKNNIKGTLRRLMSRSPLVRAAREKSVHPTKKGVRGGKQYICSKCKKVFGAKDIQVDHKKPVVPVNTTLDLMSYDLMVKRIFCEPKNLQVLCIPCHKIKTGKEKKDRQRRKTK